MFQRRGVLKLAAVLAALMAALVLSALPAAAAGSTTGSGTKAAAGPFKMQALKLTPQQVQALKKAHAAKKTLSVAEARQVIGGARGITPASSGNDSSVGPCSVINLWGNSAGRYNFTQSIYPEPGPADFGSITISTDGAFASEDNYDPVGWAQSYGGRLGWTGLWPSGTTMTGWMVTDAGWWCFGALDAIWT
jgi:hypothetical protein